MKKGERERERDGETERKKERVGERVRWRERDWGGRERERETWRERKGETERGQRKRESFYKPVFLNQICMFNVVIFTIIMTILL